MANVQIDLSYTIVDIEREEMRVLQEALRAYYEVRNDPGNHERSVAKRLLDLTSNALRHEGSL